LELLTVVLAAMILVSATVGGTIGASVPSAGGGGDAVGSDMLTRASLLNTTDQLTATGPISLSPQVRMLIHSNQSRYWRTAAYDRYTGDGWVRTGQTSPYEDGLAAPPGETDRVEQTVEPRTTLGAMPAANQPITVEGRASRTLVTTQGTIEPDEPFTTGENYTVVSQQPTADPDTLREADDYGEAVERNQQLPESTPDRIAERTDEIAGDEPTAYDTAVAVERYLETTKNYSTLVRRPEGDVADGFLFEMDAGYCTYFATTMAVMLRTQDVPARVAVGYTPGQRLARENGTDTHVVRGYDAHVWVEVYFEGVGWVAFDPTPSGPRTTVEYQRLRSAREQGTLAGIDAAGSSEANLSSELNESAIQNRIGQLDAANASAVASEPTDGEESPLPPTRTIGLWLVGLLGAAAVARRSGGFARARDTVTRYHQSRRSPTVDTERAWQRIEAQLGRSHRPRKATESARAYVRALEDEWPLDPRVREVLEQYERARYGGAIDWETADRAVAHADALTRRTLPLIGRRYQ
jgi:transglutaminase-like putative cysteine protease